MILDLGENDYDEGLAGACRGGHLNIVNMMLSLGANDYNEAFIGACLFGHIKIVKMMIGLGANDYNAALYWACFLKYDTIVKMLLELGANNYQHLNIIDNLECYILYTRLTKIHKTLPIKTQHPEYHLLNVYQRKVPDIDRIINKYLF